MNKMLHTPGPWEESGSRNIIRTQTYPNERGGLSGGVMVAQFWTTPSVADARLMAAAPELLALLQQYRNACAGSPSANELLRLNSMADDILAPLSTSPVDAALNGGV